MVKAQQYCLRSCQHGIKDTPAKNERLSACCPLMPRFLQGLPGEANVTPQPQVRVSGAYCWPGAWVHVFYWGPPPEKKKKKKKKKKKVFLLASVKNQPKKGYPSKTRDTYQVCSCHVSEGSPANCWHMFLVSSPKETRSPAEIKRETF